MAATGQQLDIRQSLKAKRIVKYAASPSVTQTRGIPTSNRRDLILIIRTNDNKDFV